MKSNKHNEIKSIGLDDGALSSGSTDIGSNLWHALACIGEGLWNAWDRLASGPFYFIFCFPCLLIAKCNHAGWARGGETVKTWNSRKIEKNRRFEKHRVLHARPPLQEGLGGSISGSPETW